MTNFNQNNDMGKFVLAVLVIGLTLVFGIYISSILATTFDTTTTANVANETGARINGTGYTVANANAAGFRSFSITQARNGSSGLAIASGNYTYTQSGLISNASAVQWNNVHLTYVYVYDLNTTSSEAASDLVNSLASGSSWVTILIVVGFAVIVLGLLSEGLSRASRRTENEFTY